MNINTQKELKVGIDEFTLVIKYIPDDWKNWIKEADDVIQEFLEKSNIENVLGKVTQTDFGKPAGYTNALTVQNADYYFAIAIHEYMIDMGIIVKFSAHAWAKYQEVYSELFNCDMNIAEFFKLIKSDNYSFRLSRIDLTADYFNYGIDINELYYKIEEKHYLIYDCNDKAAHRKLDAVIKDRRVQTIYIGSKAQNSKHFMRVYNKKLEQIQKAGFRYEEAVNCVDWTRFEVSYRGNYAHQITEDLFSINSALELAEYIASKITDKYRFYIVKDDDYTDFTNDLLVVKNNASYKNLATPEAKNYELQKAINYIIHGSGLFSTLNIIGRVWGSDAERRFLNYIYDIYRFKYKDEIRKKNKKIKSFLKKNGDALSKQTLESCFGNELPVNKVYKIECIPLEFDESEYYIR